MSIAAVSGVMFCDDVMLITEMEVADVGCSERIWIS